MSLNLHHLSTSTLAIVVFQHDKDGNEAEAPETYTGRASYNQHDNTIAVYKTGVEEPIITLQEPAFDRIHPCDDEMKAALQADYYIVLTITSAS
jgi:hypothetical protein